MPDVNMGSRESDYDPDQNPEEKRKIRMDYRKLHDALVNANANDFTTQDLTEKVEKADKLFSHVKAPQEATLDSATLVNLSNMGAVKARAMKSGTGAFDMDDFVAKLITFMGGRKGAELLGGEEGEDEYEDPSQVLRWDLIGKKAMAKSRRTPVADFMLGPLAIEQKKRNVGKRARLEKNEAEKTKPQELREEDIARSENETTKNVLLIREMLEKLTEEHTTINLFKFVINPNDFAQSVENIFHLSFLIRDGVCALDIQDGEPMIFMCEAPSDADYADGLKKQQMILQFDIDTWKRAIDVFDIKKPMIPQRPKVDGAQKSGKWYG